MSEAQRIPAAFFGHGSPMNALELNRYTHAWRAFGQAVPRPRAILVVSAHWYINATAVTAMPRPRTIHDFYGFPQELFDVRYPAPGLPELAEEVSAIVRPTWIGADIDSWGIDHGTWSVLRHAFPDADIPVVQLSINQFKDFGYHLDLGARLAPLRDRGVLIVASGNIVHNLAGISPELAGTGFDWAQRFDADAKERMLTDPAGIAGLDAHRDFASAVPTPDHFIPLLYLAGLAAAAGDGAAGDGAAGDGAAGDGAARGGAPRDGAAAPDGTTRVLVDGCAYGSLSMTAYTLGLDVPAAAGTGPAAQAPDGVPADGTNL